MRHHPTTRSGHSFLGLLSVLALLALACFVPVAQADPSGIQYHDAPPSATGTIPTQEVPATTSKKNGGAPNPDDMNNTSQSEKDSSQEEAGSGGVTGGNGGDTGQGNLGSQQGNSGNAAKAGKIAVGHALVKARSGESGDSSSSSPLVPILIAIAAVMAIAIAVVVIRQRRQRGGPDGHVSPEAS